MSVIEVDNLTKYYGSTLGIENVSFSVEQGEIFGFLGPNGAGKTTTIRLLIDLLRPNSGSIELFGTPVKRNQEDLRERIGYLPGDFSPYGDMSVARFLNYMAKFRSRPPELRKSLLDKLKITDCNLSQKIKHLSHGTRQKIGIVFALEHHPDLAILDEPTSGLDPLVQEAFYEILWEFQNNGKTVFLSSHILPEVEKVCQRVAIIRQGKIVALEEIQKLKQKRPRRLIVVFNQPIDEQPPAIPEARLLEWTGNRCVYLVEGKIPQLLRSLARLPIEDVTFPEPDLEDIFLAYYAGAGH
ncbi:MAG: ABC transporter ATP-binding protein [candidate division KSB1 bacterium]|nr:ABC transporter ATP-binding protein [candidate division KSB1 bacterium]MDZ7336774.1 ABC transporter ATP-binding protein [candidate division KSB1 bacterium]MDZ7341126.1 ABC transporter ATP-binding protein [candidate division KSB1 bacterium]